MSAFESKADILDMALAISVNNPWPTRRAEAAVDLLHEYEDDEAEAIAPPV